jgi:hypothetical protein
MTADIAIPLGQHGQLHLFTLDPAQPDLSKFLRDPDGVTDAMLAQLLGLSEVPTGSVELIRLADVSALGLRDFLIEGHDVLPETLGDAFAWLDDLTGFALIVHAAIATTTPVQIDRLPTGVAYIGAFAIGTPPPTPLSLPETELPVNLSGPAAPSAKKGAGTAALMAVFVLILVLGLLLFGVPRWPN